MNAAVVCRTCLTADSRIIAVRGAQLLHIFEKLVTKSEGRVGICYICYSQLMKCVRFVDMAQKADFILKTAARTSESVAQLTCTNSFILTPTQSMCVPMYESTAAAAGETIVSVKSEPVEVKEETTALLTGTLKTEEFTTPADISQTIKQEPAEQFEKPLQDNLSITYENKRCSTRTYKCQTCTETFADGFELQQHSATHRVKTKNSPKCVKCDKTFTTNGSLKVHTNTTRCENKMPKSNLLKDLTSKGGRDNICPICKKTLADLSSLKKHVSSHDAYKPFICDDCGKSFSHRTYIISHLRTHTKEKPFACPTCGKQFSQFGHLQTHKVLHTGTKAYHCHVCIKSFTLRSSLNKHMRTKLHTDFGIVPKSDAMIACDVCDRTFATMQRLQRHVSGHVTGAVLCKLCGESFSTSGNMKRHLKRKHANYVIE